MIKPWRFFAAILSLAVTGVIATPAKAVAPGIIPVVFIGVSTGAGPVLALGQEALNSVGISGSETRAKAETALKGADWSKAKRVSIKLEDDIMTPAWLRLKSGKPYILVMENTDGDSGSLRAPDFFANSGVAGGNPSLGWVRVGATEKREMRVIAIEKGVYDMDMGLFAKAWGLLGKIEVY